MKKGMFNSFEVRGLKFDVAEWSLLQQIINFLGVIE